MAALPQHENFVRSVNTKFQVRLDETKAVEAELTEVSELRLSPKQEQFSLVFRAPAEPFLGQGMRTLDHEHVGRLELFLVPISRDEKGICYEAVFNRLRKDT